MPYDYRYCGVGLRSEERVPELVPVAAEGSIDIGISLGTFERSTLPCQVEHAWVDGSQTTLQVARSGGHRILRFDDGAEFIVDGDNRSIACRGSLTASKRHQLLDQVLPRILSERGMLMVHGSAILTGAGAVIFIGDSGRGKSTLAASFGDVGYPILTDDCMRLALDHNRGVVCTPTYPSLRLWPDSASAIMADRSSTPMDDHSSKRRFDLTSDQSIAGATPVGAIIFLSNPITDVLSLALEQMAAPAMVAALIAQTFRLHLSSAETTQRIFEDSSAIVGRIRSAQLHYPRIHDRLPSVRSAVTEWLGSTSQN